MAEVRSRIAEVVEEFADLDGREKLELLVEYAAGLPRLPAEYEAKKAVAEGRIHECQTPVFMWMTTDPDGGAALVADVAPEAPTVKGFVAMLRGVVAPAGHGSRRHSRRPGRADRLGGRARHAAGPRPAGDHHSRQAWLPGMCLTPVTRLAPGGLEGGTARDRK